MASPVAAQARQCISDIPPPPRPRHRYVASLRATLAPDDVAIARASAAVIRLDVMLEHMRSDSNTRYKRGRAAAVEGHGFMTLGVAMTRLKRGLIPMLQSGTPMRGGSQPRRPYANTIISPMPIRVLTPAIATPRQSAAVRLSDWNLICFLRTALSRRDCPNLQESRGNPAIVPAAIHKKRFNESRQPRRPFTLRLIERIPIRFSLRQIMRQGRRDPPVFWRKRHKGRKVSARAVLAALVCFVAISGAIHAPFNRHRAGQASPTIWTPLCWRRPPQRNGPSAGALGPKFRSAGREESDTISDVVSKSADPIKFWFRSHAWPVLGLRGAHFGQYQRSGAGLFRPGWPNLNTLA